MFISPNTKLVPLTDSHKKELFDAINQNREHLTKTLSWVDSFTDINSAKCYINKRCSDPNAHWFVIYIDNRFSGIFGIKSINQKQLSCEIGYWLCHHARGQKLIQKMLPHAYQFITASLRLTTVYFYCLVDNKASIKIIKDSGAQLIKQINSHPDISATQAILEFKLELTAHHGLV